MTNGEELAALGFTADRIRNHEQYEFSHICLMDATVDEITAVKEWVAEHPEDLGLVVVQTEEMFDQPAFDFVVLAPMPTDELLANIEVLEAQGVN